MPIPLACSPGQCSALVSALLLANPSFAIQREAHFTLAAGGFERQFLNRFDVGGHLERTALQFVTDAERGAS